jgi:hypothetical protein
VREERWLVLVAPPHQPYAPWFETLGVDLARLIVVRTRSNGESLWAAERCLRAGTCAAVIAWPGPGSERSLRRLQLAAEEGKSLGVIFGPTRNAANASPAALRIQLNAARSRLEVQILKRRGGGWAPPLLLELDKTRAAPSFVLCPSSCSLSACGTQQRAYCAPHELLTRRAALRQPSSVLRYRKARHTWPRLPMSHACHALGLPSSPRSRSPAAAAGSGIVRAGHHHQRRQPAAGSLL